MTMPPIHFSFPFVRIGIVHCAVLVQAIWVAFQFLVMLEIYVLVALGIWNYAEKVISLLERTQISQMEMKIRTERTILRPNIQYECKQSISI